MRPRENLRFWCDTTDAHAGATYVEHHNERQRSGDSSDHRERDGRRDLHVRRHVHAIRWLAVDFCAGDVHLGALVPLALAATWNPSFARGSAIQGTAFALKPFAAEELVTRVCSIVG